MKPFKLVYSLFLLCGCAQIVTPDGGTKDIEEPKVIKTIPLQNSTNIYPGNISIIFNENIELKNQSTNISITPELSVKPKIKVKKNKLHIFLDKDSLIDNTTYTINFGNSIADINEGNILQNYYYSFSTGQFIDSIIISGNVVSVKDNKPIDNALIIASNLSKSNKYINHTDKNGNWIINNISKGDYTIAVVNDANFNKKADNGELYFLDSFAINKSIDNLNIKMIKFVDYKENQKQYIQKVSYINEYIIGLKFNKPLKNIETATFSINDNLYKKNNLILSPTETLDSFILIHPFYTNDSLVLNILTDSLQNLRIPIANKQKKEPLKLNCNLQIVRNIDPLLISCSIPIILINSEKVTINGNHNGFKIYTTTPFLLTIETSNIADKQIIFESGALTDINGEINKPDTINIKVALNEQVGNYEFTIKDTTSNYDGQIMVKISNEFNEYLIKTNLNKINKINGLLPANYNLEVWEDSNSNDKWDEGNYNKNIFPEKILLLNNFVIIKPNWDTLGVEIYLD